MKVVQKIEFTSGSRPPNPPKGFRSGLIKYVMDKVKEK